MQTSQRGRAFLKGHEGEVLKAYRDPVGIWTIGVGLTKASGVIVPKAGLTITSAESDRLLSLALTRNYEPAVAKAMPGAEQQEFDGGVSFHFNTGAISRASWVRSWRAGASTAAIASGLAAWNKGGGKVLPGLVRRRKEEADIINFDRWPSWVGKAPETPTVAFASFVVAVTAQEIEAIRAGFRSLGYEPGPAAGKVSFGMTCTFQRDHDLTVDGKIGRATLSALQRELDARGSALKAAGGAVGGGSVAGGGEAMTPAMSPDLDPSTIAAIGYVALGAAALYGLYLAWHYRDVIAARAQNLLPARATAWLRSF